VCPIHFHFRFLIWSSVDFSPVASHSIILLITSGHHTFNILRRQRFIKDYSFCMIEFVTLVFPITVLLPSAFMLHFSFPSDKYYVCFELW
jgi:hypothetical protein